MVLSDAMLAHYVEHGYVVAEGALTDDDLVPVIREYEDIVDGIARDLHAKGAISSLYADEPFEKRFARIAEEDEESYESHNALDIGGTRRRGTFDTLRNNNLIDLVEGFIGPEVTCNAIGHIRAKFPTDDSRGRRAHVAYRHQDAFFTTMEAHHILQVTVWFPLCDSTLENGCLRVSPGVHKEQTVYWQGCDQQTPMVPVPMKKGDVMFVHKLTPHGSSENNTDGIRWSLDVRYQETGVPSPRPEWPSIIARSRQDPSIETNYQDWADTWTTALEKTPEHIRYDKPKEQQPYTGAMYLSE